MSKHTKEQCPQCKGKGDVSCRLGTLTCGTCNGSGAINTSEPQDAVSIMRRSMAKRRAVTTAQAIGSISGEMTMRSWPQGYWGTFSCKHPCARLDQPAPTLPCDWIATQSIGLVEIAGTGTMRNFTPREGMRIMSMPDDYRWPHGTPVTAKTRIIGNGQASLMVEHLARAMSEADPESKTHISLFCGGGVGDCGWHGRAWRYAGDIPERNEKDVRWSMHL